ncbi:class III extradiol ring-cleavage dioxygenase family protein [Nocardioides pantholopis]|uniref:hypothetical protein n=1 Tax=Nocardioides pantholopis TaxID=2483798 RepID=UPI000F094FCB|nr:hypothetical protein [Nocardioides pantholopis]
MSGTVRVALVPGVLALLPEYASAVDPVPEVRAACLAAVRWLGEAGPVTVRADAQGARVAQALLEGAGVSTRSAPGGLAARPAEGSGGSYLVVGNGSACRSEKAPGHLVEGSREFDDVLGAALRAGDLAAVDLSPAERLWARLGGIPALAELLTRLDAAPAQVDYDDAPYGVQYWVMRWTGTAR